MARDLTPNPPVWHPRHDGIRFHISGSLQAKRRLLMIPPLFSRKRHVRSALAYSRRHSGLPNTDHGHV